MLVFDPISEIKLTVFFGDLFHDGAQAGQTIRGFIFNGLTDSELEVHLATLSFGARLIARREVGLMDRMFCVAPFSHSVPGALYERATTRMVGPGTLFSKILQQRVILCTSRGPDVPNARAR